MSEIPAEMIEDAIQAAAIAYDASLAEQLKVGRFPASVLGESRSDLARNPAFRAAVIGALAAALGAGETRTEYQVVWTANTHVEGPDCTFTSTWASGLETLAEAREYLAEARGYPGARIEAQTTTEVGDFTITSAWIEVPSD